MLCRDCAAYFLDNCPMYEAQGAFHGRCPSCQVEYATDRGCHAVGAGLVKRLEKLDYTQNPCISCPQAVKCMTLTIDPDVPKNRAWRLQH